MKANKEMLMREIAGETILVPTGKTALRLHGMISLSESGAILWKLLEKDRTKQEMIDVILKEYDIDIDTAEKDVQEFIDQMNDLNIIEC